MAGLLTHLFGMLPGSRPLAANRVINRTDPYTLPAQPATLLNRVTNRTAPYTPPLDTVAPVPGGVKTQTGPSIGKTLLGG